MKNHIKIFKNLCCYMITLDNNIDIFAEEIRCSKNFLSCYSKDNDLVCSSIPVKQIKELMYLERTTANILPLQFF